MGRWTQYDEDSYRLPEGVERVAYDADSGRYIFRDTGGHIYEGDPGEEYGVLKPETSLPADRPVFDTDKPLPQLTLDTGPTAKSFHDILPPDLVRVASPPHTESHLFSKHSHPSPPHSASDLKDATPRFVNAVRNTALPKMQGVVHMVMKRSATMAHAKRPYGRAESSTDNAYEKLLSGDDGVENSHAHAVGLMRSHTSASTRSTASSLSISMAKPLPAISRELPSVPTTEPLLPTYAAELTAAPPSPPPPYVRKTRRVPVPAQ